MTKQETCSLCPRRCRVDRTGGRFGYCGVGAEPVVARAALHSGEEPCISGTKGSGTVFFSGCSLGCVFCQNHEISRVRSGVPAGRKVGAGQLADIFLSLQRQGAHNINLVTAGHFVPVVAEALSLAEEAGLSVPVVYNSGGYETVETLKRLEGLVDVYLPDLKFFSPVLAERYARAPDYFDVASLAIREMVRQVGPPVMDRDGILTRGVLVRHLALPGCGEDSREIIRYLYGSYDHGIYLSIMNQFTPMPALKDYPELNRELSGEEYDALVDFALALGVENAFIQEENAAGTRCIPVFEGEDT